MVSEQLPYPAHLPDEGIGSDRLFSSFVFNKFQPPCSTMAAVTSDVRRTYQIKKLSNRNYQIWSKKMEMLLILSELWDLVSGTTIMPPAAGDPQTQCVITYAKARADIILHSGDSQIQIVHSMQTSKDVWDLLRVTYARTDVASQVNAHQELINLHLLEEDSIPDFLDCWQATLDNTVSAGLHIPPLQQVMILLSALPASWRAFVTTQTGLANITLPELISKISQEDSMRKQTDKSTPSQPQSPSNTLAFFSDMQTN